MWFLVNNCRISSWACPKITKISDLQLLFDDNSSSIPTEGSTLLKDALHSLQNDPCWPRQTINLASMLRLFTLALEFVEILLYVSHYNVF